MKPFNLSLALKGHPIQARNGQPGEFIAHVPKANKGSRVVVLVGEIILNCYEDGSVYKSYESEYDLFMAPRKRVMWVNLYEDCSWTNHYTKEDADLAADLRGDGYGGERLDGKAFKLEIEE